MDNRKLTSLLSFIADNYEFNQRKKCKMNPNYMRTMLLMKFPLTGIQIKHIMRII